MNYREYDPKNDWEAIRDIWREIGWFDAKAPDEVAALQHFFAGGRAIVADVHGRPECMVTTSNGQVMHTGTPLPMCGVMSVTTGMPARKQGLARRLTAHSIARDAANGSQLAGLGMFEQGFYDTLGFGSGPYELHFSLNPADIKLPPAERPPHRIGYGDWAAMHESRLHRMPLHGRVFIESEGYTHFESNDADNGFGLGYYDGLNGTLSHHMWFDARDLEHGPARVVWMSYRNWDQFRELMGVLRNIGDQFYAVTVPEPAGIQMQDIVHRPITAHVSTMNGPFQRGGRVLSYWQFRMNDVAACLAQTTLETTEFTFNLTLSDPIERFLDPENAWRGVAGDYVVTIGNKCSAEPGSRKGLPTLTASVNAFTRMWFGARPATGLAITTDLDGPSDLLNKLDHAFRLPVPLTDWEF